MGMSNLISQKKFSDLCGVTPPAISKAIKQERLKKIGTKIDLDCELSKDYLKLQKESNSAPKKKSSRKKTSKEKAQTEPPPESDDGAPLQLSLDLTDKQLLLFKKVEIEKLYKVEQAKEKKFNRGVARGKYIERKSVEAVFAKLYSVDTNELKEMENRLAPSICGFFKKNDDSEESILVRKLLNEEVSISLRHIKRIMDDFLKSHKTTQ